MSLSIELIARLRGALDLIPGAPSASIFEGRKWSLITISCATDDATVEIAELLGAPAPKVRQVACEGTYHRHRWLAARIERYERDHGIVQIDIIGPRRDELLAAAVPAPAGGPP